MQISNDYLDSITIKEYLMHIECLMPYAILRLCIDFLIPQTTLWGGYWYPHYIAE